MTENEELRLLLDERGVEWEAFDYFEQTTQWSTYNGAFVYWARERDGKLLVETTAPTKCSASCTPEQAVEVTLGCGMLTADDVRDLIERHSDASGGNGRDFHNGAYVAIADELNSMFGRDADATCGRHGDETFQRVYLVETSDDLLESWYPFAVYLHREAAEDCAEALRTECDGVRSFAKVSELKVVSE